MSLALLQNNNAMAINLTSPLIGVGGTPPYVYSVLAGGAGGTINASTGLYTSPNKIGIDTIQVTDSLLATAQASMLIGTPLQLFCDIIQQGMGLGNTQVYLWDQKIDIPTDYKLYIAIGVASVKPFTNIKTFDGSGSNSNQNQSTNVQATLSIDILSRGPDARDRKEEVILALNSDYSESQQELNSFRIFPISSSFVNLSEIDGTAIPYRFNISVNIMYFVSKIVAVPYFDTFSTPQIVTNS